MIAELAPGADRYVVMIRPSHVHTWWPEAEPFLLPLIEDSNGRHTVEAIHEACERSYMQLWLVFDGDDNVRGAAITETARYHGGLKALRFIGMAGEMDAVAFLPQVEEKAREQGCDVVEVIGRKGWKKVLKGYEFKAIWLEKRL